MIEVIDSNWSQRGYVSFRDLSGWIDVVRGDRVYDHQQFWLFYPGGRKTHIMVCTTGCSSHDSDSAAMLEAIKRLLAPRETLQAMRDKAAAMLEAW